MYIYLKIDDKYSLNSLNINDKFNTGEYLKLKERKKLHGSFCTILYN